MDTTHHQPTRRTLLRTGLATGTLALAGAGVVVDSRPSAAAVVPTARPLHPRRRERRPRARRLRHLDAPRARAARRRRSRGYAVLDLPAELAGRDGRALRRRRQGGLRCGRRRAGRTPCTSRSLGCAPGREYFYRFRLGRHLSEPGRAVTTPSAVGDARGRSRWRSRRARTSRPASSPPIAASRRSGPTSSCTSATTSTRAAATASAAPTSDRETTTLAGYRQRYAQYKSDPDLQAAHAAAPWLVVWDDHEVDNNYADDIAERAVERPGFLARRAAAYRAYYENMPLRRSSVPARTRPRPLPARAVGPARQLPHARHPAVPLRPGLRRRLQGLPRRRRPGALAARDSSRSSGCSTASARPRPAGTCSASRCSSVSATTTRPRRRRSRWTPGTAIRASRRRITQGWVDAGVRNPVVLTGDVHAHWASDLYLDYADPGARRSGPSSSRARSRRAATATTARPASTRGQRGTPTCASGPTCAATSRRRSRRPS